MRFLLILLLSLSANAADVTFNLADFTTGVITNRPVRIEPKSTPRPGPSDTIVSRDSITRYANTNGTFTVTNMVHGTYLCTLLGPYARTEFRIYVANTNVALNASDLLVSKYDPGIDTEEGIPIDME